MDSHLSDIAKDGSKPALHVWIGIFAASIFSGAFLLFLVQPLIGKYALPWFGGSPEVWTASMLFFQVLLVGGYAYAHLSVRKLAPKGQAALQVALSLHLED